MTETLSRRTVYSKRLRVLHGVLAVSALVLLATGWLAGAERLGAAARGYHYLAGYVFALALFWRIGLLFLGQGSEHYRDCLPGRHFAAKVAEHLKFYLSLGKTPLSGWYAHSPAWGPLYLGFFAVATIAVLSGLAIGHLYIAGLSLSGLHAFCAALILLFTGFHLLAVVLHDAGTGGTTVSAMLSGDKIFSVDPQPAANEPKEFKVDFYRPSDSDSKP
ncbi:cytochrome b/b6 domain-containing protein [Granulosicoccaceae sp. 1_MG-2023]|nr:cytochrome b/b6 domain-containing protein [Granulosicoccaceae sp. 1_MG-2023]